MLEKFKTDHYLFSLITLPSFSIKILLPLQTRVLGERVLVSK